MAAADIPVVRQSPLSLDPAMQLFSYPCALPNMLYSIGYRKGFSICLVQNGIQRVDPPPSALVRVRDELCEIVREGVAASWAVNWAQQCFDGAALSPTWTGIMFIGSAIGLNLHRKGIEGKPGGMQAAATAMTARVQ